MKILRFYTMYVALLIASAIMTVISFFKGNMIDIHLHDTMFVISPVFIFGLFFLFISILYLANRRLVGMYGKANIFLWLVLIVTWLMWMAMAYFGINGSQPPRSYLDSSSFQDWAIYLLWVERISMAVMISFFFFQLAFWLYFIVRVVSKLLKKKVSRSV